MKVDKIHISSPLHKLEVSGQPHAPATFISWGKSPRYPMHRSGPQSWILRYAEVKILDHTGTQTLDPSVIQPVATRYTDYATAAHKHKEQDIYT
jgi:hypothetical protein